MVHLDVHFDVLWKTADEEFRLLLRVADNRIVAAGVLLDRGAEGQPRELGEACALSWRPKAELTQGAEAIPRLHAFILLQRVVPCLSVTTEVV